jgi:hypothetical protein
MDDGTGPVDPARPAKPRTRRRTRADPGKGEKGPIMDERVPLNAMISRRNKMVLDNHANLWRGTHRGTISGILDDLISRHLTEVRVSHHAREGAPEDARRSGRDGDAG